MLTSLASWASLILLALAVSVDGFGVGITYGIRQIRIPPRSVLVISLCSGLVILLAMFIGSVIVEWIPPRAATAVGAVLLIAIGIWALIQFGRSREADHADQVHDDSHVPNADLALAGSRGSVGGTKSEGFVSRIKSNRSISRHQSHAADEHPHNVHATEFDGYERNHGSGGTDAIQILMNHRAVLTLEIKQWGIIIQILRTPSAADIDRSGTIQTSEAFLLGTALSLDAFGAGIGAAMIGFPPLLTSAAIAASSGLFLWLGTRVGFRVAGWRWGRPLTVLPGIILISMGLLKLL